MSAAISLPRPVLNAGPSQDSPREDLFSDPEPWQRRGMGFEEPRRPEERGLLLLPGLRDAGVARRPRGKPCGAWVITS